MRQWIAWREGVTRGSGKPGKHPIGADGQAKAWQTPAQWMTHAEAVQMADERQFAGVGLVLPLQLPGGGWLVAMDFDGVPVAGTDSDRVREVIDIHRALGCPYAEVSPSGQGIRMLLVSSIALPQTRRRPSAWGTFDEIYCANVKWVTVTGQHWGGEGLPEATVPLEALTRAWRAGG